MNDTPEPTTDVAAVGDPVEQPTSDLSADVAAVGGPVERPSSDLSAAVEQPPADLARIERDLAGVETALQRLDAGSYWSDEATGEPIPDDVLAADPVARRAP